MISLVLPNILAAWIGMLLGALAGAIQGLFFHRENWLGGYASWPRRMTRLGHIAFFGLALVNLGFAFTASALQLRRGIPLASILFILGHAAMPALCYLSAFKPAFRRLFFIPVLSVIGGAAITLWSMTQS